MVMAIMTMIMAMTIPYADGVHYGVEADDDEDGADHDGGAGCYLSKMAVTAVIFENAREKIKFELWNAALLGCELACCKMLHCWNGEDRENEEMGNRVKGFAGAWGVAVNATRRRLAALLGCDLACRKTGRSVRIKNALLELG